MSTKGHAFLVVRRFRMRRISFGSVLVLLGVGVVVPTILPGTPARAESVVDRESVQATWLVQSRSRTLIFLEFSASRSVDVETGRTSVQVDLRRRRCREGNEGTTLRCRSFSKDLIPVQLLTFDVDSHLETAEAVFRARGLTSRIRWTRRYPSAPALFSHEGGCPRGSEQGSTLRQRAKVSGRVLASHIDETSSRWNRFWVERGVFVSDCSRSSA